MHCDSVAYYKALAILDRINDEIYKKYRTAYEFSRQMGWKAPCTWGVNYNLSRIPKPPMIQKIAKVLDVSVEYLFDGKERKPYTECTLSLNRIIKEWRSRKKSTKISCRFSPMIANYKNGLHSISLPTAFEFEEIFKIPAYQLLFEEKK